MCRLAVIVEDHRLSRRIERGDDERVTIGGFDGGLERAQIAERFRPRRGVAPIGLFVRRPLAHIQTAVGIGREDGDMIAVHRGDAQVGGHRAS